ncbi:MAG: hypothetical protein AB1333_01445 [Patescibacteria group bacterium]
MSSFTSIEIVKVFFKNTGYSKEAEDVLSPFILSGPSVIHEFVSKNELSLQLICEAKVAFVDFLLSGDFLQSVGEVKRDDMRVRLESLRTELLQTISQLKKDKVVATFIEEWTFCSGNGWVRLNNENAKLYADNVLTLVGLLETQPEIFFAL